MQERRLRTFARTDLLKALTAAYAAAVERAEHEERDLYLKRAYNACQTLARQERLDRAAAPAALRLRGTLQWLRGKHGRATALWRDSSNRATALRLPHELALTQLEAGHRTGDLAITSAASRQLSELAGNLTSHERAEAPTAV